MAMEQRKQEEQNKREAQRGQAAGVRAEAPVIEKREEQSLVSAENLPAGKEIPRSATAPATYRALVKKYKKRQHDTLVDTLTTGLTYADEMAVDLGLMEDTGLLGEVTEVVSTDLPFAVIAVTEQAKVIMGKKTQKEAAQNTVFRMAKTGAALGIGAVAGAFGGIAAAIPAALGMRALMDGYKSKSMLNLRVRERTDRLRALRERRVMAPADARPALPVGITYLDSPVKQE